MIKTLPEIGHTHEVGNGEEALDFILSKCNIEIVVEQCPDLILLDLNMPVMDGFEFLEAFKQADFQNKDKVRIVVVTSSSNPKDMERLKAYDIWKFVNKPLTPAKMEAIMAA